MCNLHTFGVSSTFKSKHDACKVVGLATGPGKDVLQVAIDVVFDSDSFASGIPVTLAFEYGITDSVTLISNGLDLTRRVHVDLGVLELVKKVPEVWTRDNQRLIAKFADVVYVFGVVLCISFEPQR